MRCSIYIVAACLALAACSRPPDTVDAEVPSEDAGPSTDADTTTDLESTDMGPSGLRGELLVDVPQDAEDVRIYDGGSFLFVVTDERDLAWVSKEGGPIISYATWPDRTRPDDGPPSRDTTWDDEHFWFLTESAPGSWTLIGVEHFLGNPTPFFGQPIIIIDVGPGEPGGLSLFGGLFVVPMMDEIVTVSEGGTPVRTPYAGTPVFDRFEGPWAFLATDDGFELAQYGPSSGQFSTFETLPEQPLAFAAAGDTVYFLSADGALRAEGGLAENDSSALVDDAAPTDTPILAAGAAGAAWTSGDEVHLYTDEVVRFEVEDVDAIVVDETSVYWSGADGIFVAPIAD